MTEKATPLLEAPAEHAFRELARAWKAESICMSSVTDMISLPSYQGIIRMGRSAIPLLLGELQHEPNHWFVALTSITGEDPVPLQDRGDMDKMAEAWLRWGRERGYHW